MRPMINTLNLSDYEDIKQGVDLAMVATEFFRSKGARIEIPTTHRWWEYGTAIQMLLDEFGSDRLGDLDVMDVGSGWGAFGPALAYHFGTRVTECEPGNERFDRRTINSALASIAKPQMNVIENHTDNLPDGMFDMVTCISVIEHMPATVEARAWGNLVSHIKPGGLFFADVDCVFDQTKSYVFDELRAHNFTCDEMQVRVGWLKELGMEPFRGEEYTYNGNMIHDFTFFRIGMRKRS